MNVNCKISMTDEKRNVMFRRLTGKNGKGMVSRAEVCNWVNEKLESFLNGSFGTQTARFIPDPDQEPNFKEIDYDNIDVAEVMKQNELLLSRVNKLQYMIDTRGLKK